jgi:hypothetical protein
MDLNLPVFATGVRIFRASNDVGPLFLDPGSTRILERNKHVDPGSRNRGPTSLLALKIRTPVANTGKLRSNGQVPVARGGEILYFTASRRRINIDFLL